MLSLINQDTAERPNEKALLVRIFSTLGIGTISVCVGLSGTLNDGKGVPKIVSLLLGSGLCGYSAYSAYVATKDKQIWNSVLEVEREVIQQAAAIRGEIELEAYQAITEEQVLNRIAGGVQPVVHVESAQPQTIATQAQPIAQAQPQTVQQPVAQTQTVQQPVAAQVETQPITDLATGEYQWIADMRNTGTLLVCGGQGSGKTSKLQYLQRYHKEQNAVIWVFDPHAAYGQYPGFENASNYLDANSDPMTKNLLFGAGMRFEEINKGMEIFVESIKERYKKRADIPNYDAFQDTRIILVCEEMQNWSKNVAPKLLVDFVDFVLTSTRKANFGVVISAQSEKVSQFLGKACKGNADLVETSMAKALGSAIADPSIPGGYRPGAKARWKAAGTESWEEVTVPNWLK